MKSCRALQVVPSTRPLLTLGVTLFLMGKIVSAQEGVTNPDAPIFHGDVLLRLAEFYAVDFKVSIDEAMRRLQYGAEVRKLQRYLIEKHPDEYAGLWVQHLPAYRILIRTTDVDRIRYDRRVATSPVREVLTVVDASVSLSQLTATQKDLQAILLNFGISFDAGINVIANRVEIYGALVDDIFDVLQKRNVSLPSYVRLVQVDQLSQPTEDIYAGLSLDRCTTGFSVLHDDQGEGVLGISTAGHCGCASDYCSCQNPPCSNTDPVYYNGILLPLQGVEYHNSYDIEWHTAPGYRVRNLFFDGTYNVYVYGIRNHTEQYVGEYVCKYGVVTDSGCGLITTLNYYWSARDGYFVRVDNDTTNLAEHGDSGGSWYYGNIVYGITTALIPYDDNGHNDALYMPVDNYDILNLCILRDEANPTVPELDDTLENGVVILTWNHGDDVCGYEIHRSESSYFTPTDSTLVIRITANVVSFSSGVGVGDPNHNYYYRIKAITGSDSPPSNTVGEFDFTLVPGN